MTDKEQVKKLWQYCFTDSDEYVEYYFENIYDEKNNYIIKNDERVVCSLMTNKYKINANNKVMQTSYIVGVSSSPVDRGSGYASKLIKNTLNDLYKKGEEITMLMPIDTKIYTRYGFANIYDMLEMDIPLDRIDSKNNELKSVIYDDSKINDLINIYNECIKEKNIFLSRDLAYYKKLISEIIQENGEIIICYDSDIPISYMIFYPKHVLGESGFVREIFSINKSGYDKLFAIVKTHFTQIKNVILHTYPMSYVHKYFEYDNKIKYTLKPFMMIRVLNVQKSLENMMKYTNVSELTKNISNIISHDYTQKSYEKINNLKLRITDEIIKENNIVFDISAEKISATDEKEDLTMSIYDFAKLYKNAYFNDYV